MSSRDFPPKTECPECHAKEATTSCRFCGISKIKPRQPAPAEACCDPEDLREDFDPGEDERLDDPRHGQAAGINRDNKGRSEW